VKLAIAAFDAQAGNDFMTLCERLTEKEIRLASRMWHGLTNPEISRLMGTAEPVTKHQLRSTFDKLGVWSWRCMGLPNPRISGSQEGQPVRRISRLDDSNRSRQPAMAQLLQKICARQHLAF
jgi:DNA-binding NarL/FixJ family response regulator